MRENGGNDTVATEPHNEDTDRQEIRSQFRELYQEFGSQQEQGGNNALLQLLSQMIPESLQEEWLEQMDQSSKKGCPESFIDSLPRIPKSRLTSRSSCSICCSNYLEDEYPLVVQLPHCQHEFDLECIGVWLSKSTTCPLCRDDVMSHKVKIDTSQVEEEEDWGMYG